MNRHLFPFSSAWARISALLALIAFLTGFTGFLGWLTHYSLLKSILSDGATMKVNTALIIIMSSLSLLVLHFRQVRFSRLLALLVMVLTCLILVEHLWQINLKIDELFFTDSATDPLKEAPGRTSILTSLNALLLSVGLLSLSFKRYTLAQLLAGVTFVLVYASLLGHFFGINGFYQLGFYSGIAFNTALSLLLLSAAILLYQPQQGFMAYVYIRLSAQNMFIYLLSYFLCAVPVLVALYLFIIGHTHLSSASGVLVLLIITAVISIPVGYLLLSRLSRLDTDLKNSNEQLTIAIQASGMGVWDRDMSDGTVTGSKRMAELFGQGHIERVSTEKLWTQVYDQDREGLKQAFILAEKTGMLEAQVRIVLPEGQIVWIQVYGQTKYDQGGSPIRMMGTVMDITSRKELERHKDEFISTVSHELKTPITSIKAHTQILERRFSTADVITAAMLNRINVQINRLNTIIKDLLQAGQVEEHHLLLRKEEFYFKRTVAETVAEVQRTTTSHRLVIQGSGEITCTGDKERTCQVLTNLLTNAIKYSPGKDKVIIAFEEKDNQVICSVQDFGLGIAKEKQAYVFDRFYRATDSGTSKMISGFGLGLYISCEIIKRMGGKIWLSSMVGEGSTFYFSIPKVI